MPARIDRVGRAHEWLTSAWLNEWAGDTEKAAKERAEADGYLGPPLTPTDRKRAEVGAENSANWIRKSTGSNPVRRSEVVGEASKKPGGPDFDVELTLADGTSLGYSLKIQDGVSGVNVRNPTLNSFLRYTTGLTTDETFSADEKDWYKGQGALYVAGTIESRVIGHWAAPIITRALAAAQAKDPTAFLGKILKEMRVGTNLLVTSVDKNGNFLGHATKYGSVISRLSKTPAGLSLTARGISTFLVAEGVEIAHIDWYMLVDGSRRTNKLRAALRYEFAIDH